MSGNVARIKYFGIGRDSRYNAIYTKTVDQLVGGGNYKDLIQQAVAAKDLPVGAQAVTQVKDQPYERNLHINMKNSSGTYAFVFRSEVFAQGEPELTFVMTEPFVELPLSHDGTKYIADFAGYQEDNRPRWASFVCDLDAARNSILGQRIHDLARHPADPLAHIRAVLRIPFIFNVVDSLLGAAPWAVPGHDDSKAAAPFSFTHGGVHPNVSTYLTLDV